MIVAGFDPPPYPYDRLGELTRLAQDHPGGMVDLSVGTPADPPPAEVVAALATSGSERGYPASAGSPELRREAAAWLGRRFGVDIEAGDVAACVGTKELVASTAWFLRLRSPESDVVLHPAVAYPTYALGARLAGCRSVGVPERASGGLDLSAVDDADARRAVVLWVNSPSNPSGSLTDLGAAADWGRRHQVPVLSDECYAEFTWSSTGPATILQHGSAGVVAVHSLSKRSNLAGVRSGFYAGDPALVRYLADVRKHAGLMVPGPVQAASAVAYADDLHVQVQRQRYLARLHALAGALGQVGLPVDVPDGGFYLWVPVPEWAVRLGAVEGRSSCWVLAELLARVAGMLVSPGDFYGSGGSDHVRAAVVQPDDRIQVVCDRLRSIGTLEGRSAEGR